MPHKNIRLLSAAVFLLRERGFDVALILTGQDTAQIGRGILTETSICVLPQADDDWTVSGLGYVSDEELAALMLESIAVVTPSLYEAGNGPGIDAWHLGVPVAMSNLPFYTEHIDRWGVRAVLFNPMDVNSIAGALEFILKNPEEVKEDALHSQKIIRSIEPNCLAKGYIKILENITNNHSEL